MASIRPMLGRAALTLGVPLALALLALGALPARAVDQSVTIQNLAFSPATVNVNVGDTVTWTNQDGSIPHTVTSDTGVFGSGQLGQGQSFSHTFTQAGSFPYFCAIHPTMTGTVVVAAAGGGGAGGGTTPTTAASPGATTTTTAQAPATGTGLESGGRDSSWAPVAVLMGGMAVIAGAASLVVIRARTSR